MAVNLRKFRRNVSHSVVQINYVKKDGTARTMLVTQSNDFLTRNGAIGALKGGDNNSDPAKHIVVWSVFDNGWRTLIAESIQSQRIARVA